jgi:GNAT superfamily N-acetyltransferase
VTALTGLVVRELAPKLLNDYLTFFDRDAFADFPWWSSCFCTFYNDPEHDGNSSAEKRDVRRPRGIELVTSGQTQGLLAYDGERVIGWCNAAPRSSYRALRRFAAVVDDPAEAVGSTMCFIVAAPYRGKGVAAALLDAACEKFRAQGLRVAEGYPMTAEPTGPYAAETPWSAHNYHGPLSMYLKAGFAIHRQFERFAVVRKALDRSRELRRLSRR